MSASQHRQKPNLISSEMHMVSCVCSRLESSWSPSSRSSCSRTPGSVVLADLFRHLRLWHVNRSARRSCVPFPAKGSAPVPFRTCLSPHFGSALLHASFVYASSSSRSSSWSFQPRFLMRFLSHFRGLLDRACGVLAVLLRFQCSRPVHIDTLCAPLHVTWSRRFCSRHTISTMSSQFETPACQRSRPRFTNCIVGFVLSPLILKSSCAWSRHTQKLLRRPQSGACRPAASIVELANGEILPIGQLL